MSNFFPLTGRNKGDRKLIVDGGHAHQPNGRYDLGGGGGGIVQIIAPMGNLANDTLSMRHGKVSGQCDYDATSGHFLLTGNYSYIKTKLPGI